jgi:hypothetical protein
MGRKTPVFLHKLSFLKGFPMNSDQSSTTTPVDIAKPVTQEQLNDLASNIAIAMHALREGIEIVALKPDALTAYLPELKAKIDHVNPYR